MKNFNIGEKAKLQFSTEMFNLFNFANVVIGPVTINNANSVYGPGVCFDTASCTVNGQVLSVGSVIPARSTFMQLYNADGSYNRNNNQLGTPFQAQFGLRFIF